MYEKLYEKGKQPLNRGRMVLIQGVTLLLALSLKPPFPGIGRTHLGVIGFWKQTREKAGDIHHERPPSCVTAESRSL